MKRNWGKRLLLLTVFLVCCAFSGYLGRTAAGYVPQEEVSTEEIGEDTVLVGGMPVGIYMETEGVLVLDTQGVKGMDGQQYEPARNLVKAGDYIVGINQQTITDKRELMESLQNLTEDTIVLMLRREDETMEVKLHAVECSPEEYKLGIWVRDNVQGLGTITFLDQNSRFGALGHGIHDTDTNVLLEISGGSLYRTVIRSVTKGENGVPGSMEGLIVYNRYNRIGTVLKNTETGIYGTIEEIDAVFEDAIPVKVAAKEEIVTGDAEIRCYVNGEIKEYQVQIKEINESVKDENKGIVLQVTDKELLEETGGVIQGMSGSPILQNGKLIGAVTHVFVNDPTKGYGIFAETMIKEAEELEKT